jgi:O-antigen ligase
MMEFIKGYRAKAWPELEIPTINKPQLLLLVFYTVAMIVGGWLIWFSGKISADRFLYLGLGIPILLLAKSRYLTLVALLSLQVILAFLFVGNSGYVIYFIAALAGSIIAFQSSTLMYMFLIFAVWFDTSAFVSGLTLGMEFTIGVGLLLGWIFKDVLLSRTETQPIRYFPKWSAIGFLAWVIIGLSFWSFEPGGAGLTQVKQIVTHILFFLITPLVINDRTKVNTILWTWLVVGLIAAAATVIAPFLGYAPEAAGWGGGTSIFTWHKNISASFLCFSYFVTYALWKRKATSMQKFLLFVCILINFSALFKLGSKSAMIGLMVGTAFFVFADTFLNPRRRNTLRMLRNAFFLVSFVTLMTIMIYFMSLAEEMLGTYNEIFTQGTQASSMEMRKVLWQASWEIIGDEHHPIRGLGPGAFWVIGLDYVPISYFITQENKDEPMTGQSLLLQTHSLYLDLFMHYGVLGTILFLWLVFYLLFNLWKLFRNATDEDAAYLFLGLLCAFLAFLVHSTLEFSMFNIARFWIFAGLAVAVMSNFAPKEKDESYKTVFKERLHY